MTDENDLIRWSEALSGIARTGMAFTENLYERERYGEILHVAAEIHSRISESGESSEKVIEWMQSVGKGTLAMSLPKLLLVQ